MQYTKPYNKLIQHIDDAINRTHINCVICYSKLFENKSNSELERFLKDSRNKISIDRLYFFNNLSDVKNGLNTDDLLEEAAIANKINQTIEQLQIEAKEIISAGWGIYQLNDCFKIIFDKINVSIENMNYHYWLSEKNPNANNNVLYLLRKKNHQGFSKFQLDIDTTANQRRQIGRAFAIRQSFLQELKNAIIELYASELFYPTHSTLPSFSYSCSKVDICELIYSIDLSSKHFSESRKLAELLLELFGISSSDYSKNKRDIHNRVKEKSIFLSKLASQINALKPLPPKNKKEE